MFRKCCLVMKCVFEMLGCWVVVGLCRGLRGTCAICHRIAGLPRTGPRGIPALLVHPEGGDFIQSHATRSQEIACCDKYRTSEVWGKSQDFFFLPNSAKVAHCACAWALTGGGVLLCTKWSLKQSIRSISGVTRNGTTVKWSPQRIMAQVWEFWLTLTTQGQKQEHEEEGILDELFHIWP